MSDTDSFIGEVTEEVRRDRLFKYVRKYGWIAVVAVIGVVAVTGYIEWQKLQAASRAEALGDRLIAVFDAESALKRAEALSELGSEAGEAQIIVDLRRAAELVEAGDPAAALVVFDGIANSGVDAVYSDMARLKALILRGSDLDTATRDAALSQMAIPGAPYRPLAMEQQAIAALASDDTNKAIETFNMILQDSEASDALRNRATQTILALGGKLPEVPKFLSE